MDRQCAKVPAGCLASSLDHAVVPGLLTYGTCLIVDPTDPSAPGSQWGMSIAYGIQGGFLPPVPYNSGREEQKQHQ